MTKYETLFADELKKWLLEAGFVRYKFQMSIYYNYAPYVTKIVIFYYVNDCVYWYISEALGKKLWML